MPIMSPTTAPAVVIRGKKLVTESLPVPVPGEHELLVKISHAAQNPTDVFGLSRYDDGTVLGCDLVGTVEQIGSGVTKFKPGAVIVGLLWGGQVKGIGAFSSYTLVDEQLSFPLPENISPEEAATLPLASGTAIVSLFSKDCLNITKDSDEYVLIWGGTSSVGLYAIQIAKHYGLRVITTCSPRNFEHVKSLGASHAFDYRDKDLVSKIKEATGSRLRYIFDTIGNETSSAVSSQALSEAGGTLCTVRPGKKFTENVTKQTFVTDVLLWTILDGETIERDIGSTFPAIQFKRRPGDRKLAMSFFEEFPKLLSAGIIKPNTPKVFNGLDEVTSGFQEYTDGVVSNYKIVYAL